MSENFVNNSAQSQNVQVPAEVLGHFNWGALLLSWIWGLGNKTYITLSIFATILISWIPVIGQLAPLALCIWFGIKGNEWAWQNKQWDSVEHFHSVQRTWAAWGIGLFAVSLVLCVIISILVGVAATVAAAK